MVKIVREGKPQLLVLCDASCFAHMTMPFAPGEPNLEEKQQAQFAVALLAAGWKVSLARQICPEHAHREADARLLAMEVSPFKN